MNARKALATALLILAPLAAACSTEPGLDFLTSFDFQSVSDGNGDKLPAIAAEAGAGTIQVVGGFLAPCSPGPPAGKAEHTSDVITLIFDIPRFATTCPAMSIPYTYRALLTQVPPGAYTLRVEHYRDASRQGGLAFEQQIEVR